MTTYMANKETVNPKWYLVDAKGKTVGRLATQIASRLRGKHKAEFTPYVDTGDFIVVVNVEQLKLTGKKEQDKFYHQHSGYIGGMKSINFADLQVKNPARILELAVKGMLPKGPLGRAMFLKLKMYVGSQHPHAAQQPESIDL